MWFFATQSGAVAQVETRVLTLERARDDQMTRWQDVSNRLARMEPLLELLVRKTIKD